VIDERERSRIEAALPLLRRLGPEMTREFLHEATLARIPANRDLMAEGERVEAVPIVLSGTIRVYRIGDTGREITLYRFTRGECCVLSADSILGHGLFPAHARTEEDAEVALMPAAIFNRWLDRSPDWRAFVLHALSRRLVSLVDTVDEVAFRRMDVRVADLLLGRSGGRKVTVPVTHQAIADDLGSSREVISRVLEDLQSRGLIRLSRGAVDVLDPLELERSSRL
jgi:CRP/FNR family transcriptional regulator